MLTIKTRLNHQSTQLQKDRTILLSIMCFHTFTLRKFISLMLSVYKMKEELASSKINMELSLLSNIPLIFQKFSKVINKEWVTRNKKSKTTDLPRERPSNIKQKPSKIDKPPKKKTRKSKIFWTRWKMAKSLTSRRRFIKSRRRKQNYKGLLRTRTILRMWWIKCLQIIKMFLLKQESQSLKLE